MKQRFFLLLCAFCLTVAAGAKEIEVDGVQYYCYEGQGEAYATGYLQGRISELQIPARISDGEEVYNVLGLQDFSCGGDENLTSVVIGAPISYLDEGFFRGCTALRSVELPEELQYIPNSFFEGCTALSSITIPEHVTEILTNAFGGCTSLSEVVVPASVNYVSVEAFSGCTALTRFSFANSSEALNLQDGFFQSLSSVENLYVGRTLELSDWDGPLRNAAKLTQITYGGEATYVPYRLCYQAPALETVEIGGKVDSIAGSAFAECPRLTSVSLPEGLRVLESDVFYNDTALAEISLPAGLEVLGSSAFRGCTRIEQMTVPEGIRRLSNYLFSGCTALRSLTLPADLEGLGSGTFQDCSSLTSVPIPAGLRVLPDYVFSGCTALDSIALPNSIEVIGPHAFGSCRGLEALSFGAGVDTIRDGAFYECTGLKRFYYEGDVADWCDTYLDFESYTEDTNPLSYADLWYLPGEEGSWLPVTDLVIPDEVDSIRAIAFYNYRGAQRLTVSDSVRFIGEQAFADCLSLTSAYIGARELDTQAFLGCLGLDTVTLGPKVRKLGEMAFYYCNGVQDVFFEGPLMNWFFLSFVNSSANPLNGGARFHAEGALVEDLVVPQYIIEVPDYSFYGCSSLKSVRMHPQVVRVGEYSFASCPNLQVLSGESAAAFAKKSQRFSQEAQGLSIGTGAYENCTQLASVSFPVEVVSVGRYAFSGTAWLDNQPDGVVYIDGCAYTYKGVLPAQATLSLREGTTSVCADFLTSASGRENLTALVLPQGVTRIGSMAFWDCSALASLSLPASLRSIEASAFQGCTSLAGLPLPDGLEEVGGHAFAGCSAVTSLAVPGSVRSFETSALSGMTALRHLEFKDGSDTLVCPFSSGVSYTDIPLEYAYVGRNMRSTPFVYGSMVVETNLQLFQNSTTLEEVVIGPQVTELDGLLFFGCSGLKQVSSVSPEPPLCLQQYGGGSYYNFYGVDYASCLLRVPAGAKEAYAAAGGWSDFLHVEEDPTVGIETITADPTDVSAVHYDVSGRPVAPDAKGIHIVRYSDGRTEKVLVE